MKRVYRHEANEAYWDRRWAEAGSDSESFEDLTIYPIRYAEMVMQDKQARALELGCGLGRVLKHYARQGFRMSGLERSHVAVERLRNESAGLDVVEGDVLKLPYANSEFDVVMAFGVFHNLEYGLEQALAETARVLRPGGRFAISMRPNNIEMNGNEIYWRWRSRGKRRGPAQFHKLLVGRREFRDMLAVHGLETGQIHYARNVSLWYRVPFLRRADDAQASEAVRRALGYRLNAVGRAIDRASVALLPYQTSNAIVYIGKKSKW